MGIVNFHGPSGGGGISLPDTIYAGNTALYAKTGISSFSHTSYTNQGVGYGFTALKPGTYRITFGVSTKRYGNSNTAYARLTINDIYVTSSEISVTSSSYTSAAVEATIDVTLAANHVLRLQTKDSTATWDCFAFEFAVCVLADDLQDALYEIIEIL